VLIFLELLMGFSILMAYIMIEKRINQRRCSECGNRVSKDDPGESCPRCGERFEPFVKR
jgi:rubrerythrin